MCSYEFPVCKLLVFAILLARWLYVIDILISQITPLFMDDIRESSKEGAGVHYIEQLRAVGLS